jgi:hypothetical protein
MRYRLRWLLFLMAVLPPMAAVAWRVGAGDLPEPILLAVVIYMSMLSLVLLLAWVREASLRVAKRLVFKNRREGICSFCKQDYRAVGPLAEGPDGVYICRHCVQTCGQIIEDELRRLGEIKDGATVEEAGAT